MRKDPEETIEKVLVGLRDADAPVGMERRILNAMDALEDHSSPRCMSGWRRLRPIWLVTPARPVASWSLACAVALAGLFAFAITIPAIRRLGHSSARSSTQFRTDPSLATPRPSVAPEAAANNASLLLSAPSGPSTRKTNAPRPEIPHDSDAAALSEMRSDSFPAPPMPLTEQERLLLRIAHKADPVELAMLDPMQRAARDAQEKADVNNFFEPSTTGQSATKP